MALVGIWRRLYPWLVQPFTPRSINVWGPVWCLVTMIGGWWNVHVTSPSLYTEHLYSLKIWNDVISYILIAEILINWLCIRYVGSNYSLTHLEKAERRFDRSSILPTSHRSRRDINEIPSSRASVEIYGSDKTYSKDTAVSPITGPVMYVVSGFSGLTGLPERTAYPYWSWVPCVVCNHSRPPRCHHCSLCKTCVLKRDHHCFFAGSCIGYRNMRHFIVYCFWAVLSCTFCLIHTSLYFYSLYEQTTVFDLLPVFVHIRWILGFTNGFVTALITVAWSAVFFLPLAANFVYEGLTLTAGGQTTYERENNIKIPDNKSRRQMFQAVFGRYWLLNILSPFHKIFPALEDPIQWPTVNGF